MDDGANGDGDGDRTPGGDADADADDADAADAARAFVERRRSGSFSLISPNGRSIM